MENDNALALLKLDMDDEEVPYKVNAIHRLKTVILSIGAEASVLQLIPYLEILIKEECDEVHFAIADELGQCFHLLADKTAFLPLLEKLAIHDETVVREFASDSLVAICKTLSEAEIQAKFVPMVLRLTEGEPEKFTGKMSSTYLFTVCYAKSGDAKEQLR